MGTDVMKMKNAADGTGTKVCSFPCGCLQAFGRLISLSLLRPTPVDGSPNPCQIQKTPVRFQVMAYLLRGLDVEVGSFQSIVHWSRINIHSDVSTFLVCDDYVHDTFIWFSWVNISNHLQGNLKGIAEVCSLSLWGNGVFLNLSSSGSKLLSYSK